MAESALGVEPFGRLLRIAVLARRWGIVPVPTGSDAGVTDAARDFVPAALLAIVGRAVGVLMDIELRPALATRPSSPDRHIITSRSKIANRLQ